MAVLQTGLISFLDLADRRDTAAVLSQDAAGRADKGYRQISCIGVVEVNFVGTSVIADAVVAGHVDSRASAQFFQRQPGHSVQVADVAHLAPRLETYSVALHYAPPSRVRGGLVCPP